MQKLWNPIQPQRPEFDGQGYPLLYRTHISDPASRFKVFSDHSIIAQAHLYWYACNEFIPDVSQFDLHNYLFSHIPELKIRTMGMVMVQTTIYNNRSMKGETVDNPKACAIYRFRQENELIYGLEWMLSMWIGRATTLNEVPTLQDVTENLEALRELDDIEDVEKYFIEPMLTQGAIEELPVNSLRWVELWKRYDMRRELEPRPTAPRPAPPMTKSPIPEGADPF